MQTSISFTNVADTATAESILQQYADNTSVTGLGNSISVMGEVDEAQIDSLKSSVNAINQQVDAHSNTFILAVK